VVLHPISEHEIASKLLETIRRGLLLKKM